MAKVRSPNYPALDLVGALNAVRKALDKDNRNKMSQAALGKHLGHDSLSGPALGKIGALRAYGLIDGKGDELRITDEAVTALMAPPGSPEGVDAIRRLAGRPNLFQDIQKEFATLPSAENLKFWLIKRQFAPDAAEKAAKCYLSTMQLAEWGSLDYDATSSEHQEILTHMRQDAIAPVVKPPSSPPPLQPKAGVLQEVFNLDEGPVTLTFPAKLSTASFHDLKDYFELFLRKAKRQADERPSEAFKGALQMLPKDGDTDGK
jgi:hypothetical protein